jgi:hypothetical protein
MTASRRLSLAIGALGLAAGGSHAYWFWRMATNEGNPLGLVFAVGAMLSLPAAAGLLFALSDRSGASRWWKVWLALAGPAGLLAAALAAFFTVMFLTH